MTATGIVQRQGSHVDPASNQGSPLLLGLKQGLARIHLKLQTNVGRGHFTGHQLDHFVPDVSFTARELVGNTQNGISQGNTRKKYRQGGRHGQFSEGHLHRFLSRNCCCNINQSILMYISLDLIYTSVNTN